MRSFLLCMDSWYDAFDVQTYSFGQPTRVDHKIQRLLAATKPINTDAKQVRVLGGLHSKLWICYGPSYRGRRTPKAVYVGSFNVGAPTLENIMVRTGHTRFWVKYFDELWEQAIQFTA